MTVLIRLHPGEVLREEFLNPMVMTIHALAERCRVPHSHIARVVAEEIGIDANLALRLGAALGTTPEFWLNLQSGYEIEMAKG
jgi:antitoxin HigA-1